MATRPVVCVCMCVCVRACVRACICIFKWETWRRNRHRLFSAICQFHSPTAKNKMTIYKNKYKGIRLTGVGYKLHSLQQVSHPTHVNLEPAMPTHVCPSSSKLATPATASTCFIPSPVSEQTKTLSYQHCACAGVFFYFFFTFKEEQKHYVANTRLMAISKNVSKKTKQLKQFAVQKKGVQTSLPDLKAG